MGLDLTLIPLKYITAAEIRANEPGRGWLLGYNRISLDRNYGVLDQIKSLHSDPLPEAFNFEYYEDEGLKKRTTDPYGAPLRYVRAAEFNNVGPGDTGQWNRAVLSFMRELPADTPVVLWWH